jgi:hypothetical protein
VKLKSARTSGRQADGKLIQAIVQIQVADLIPKQRATGGLLDAPALALSRTGEGAPPGNLRVRPVRTAGMLGPASSHTRRRSGGHGVGIYRSAQP